MTDDETNDPPTPDEPKLRRSKTPKRPTATPEKYLARARVRSSEHRQTRKEGRVPERRVIASAILTVLLERDAFARLHGRVQLDVWFDDVVRRLHRSYDRDAAKRVIGPLRAAALERREKREAIVERMGRLQGGQGE